MATSLTLKDHQSICGQPQYTIHITHNVPGTRMMTDELLAFLFDEHPHLLAGPMAGWLASSRTFTAFAAANRDKIRKKLRSTREHESLLDLRLELETAYLLLQERSLSLVYEPQRGGRVRGPDFAVTYTTSMTFMLEVTRLHARPNDKPADPEEQTQALPAIGERLAYSICSKLRQIQPQHSNVLLVNVEAQQLTQSDLRATMLHIQRRAEQNDPNFLRRHRFRDRASFFHSFLCLSEIMVRGAEAQIGASRLAWINPQAKYPLPGKVRTVLHRSHQVRQGFLEEGRKHDQ